VRDPQTHEVRAQRWECTTCHHVFRVYPQGVTHRQQSLRLQGLSVYLWILGLSFGAVSDLLGAFTCPLGRTTVFDNVQRAATAAYRRRRAWLKGKVQVQVVAMDPTHVRVKGKDTTVMQSVDAQTGVTIDIMILPGEDERVVLRYVQRMAAVTGCRVIVTDDADTFKTAADTLGIAHSVCQQHVVPNTLRLVSEIAEQLEALPPDASGPTGLSPGQALEDLALLEEIILARTPGSTKDLQRLQQRYQDARQPNKGKRATPWYRLRLLTLDLAEDWHRLTLSDWYRDGQKNRLVPATNNVSERGIGLDIKERYRTMRGYKSKTSVRNIPLLTAYLRERQGRDCLSDLLIS
jgi:transposase-like protein